MAELILYLRERELSRYRVRTAAVRIGRDPSSDLVIDNMGISRHHASVIFDGNTFLVKDEGSQNGVFVNGTRVGTHAINHGDVIQLGKFALRFERTMNDDSTVLQPSDPAPRYARDPQATLALQPDEVRNLLQQHSSQDGLPAQRPALEQGPVTRREPPPQFVQTPVQTADNSLMILLVGLGVVVAIGVLGYFALIH